jgi:non-specific serine/threonine protein kinase
VAGSIYWYWMRHGPRNEGKRWLKRGRLAPATTERQKTHRMWVMEGISLLARQSGDYEESTNAARECHTLATELGNATSEAAATALLGYVALAQGDYERAEALMLQAIDLKERIGDEWGVTQSRAHLGQVKYGQRELDMAAMLLEEAITGNRGYVDQFDLAAALGFLALVRCDQRRHQDAASLLAEALPIWQDLDSQENLAEWLADVATLAAGSSLEEAGARFMGAASTLRDVLGHAFVLPERNAYERAEQSMRDALGLAAYDRARQAGSSTPIQQALADATAFLEQVRIPTARAGAERALAPFGVTARELEVLRLLAEGKSDKEIAEALFIGLRTVETHVSNLLAKLGARNRAEAAALATRQNLL